MLTAWPFQVKTIKGKSNNHTLNVSSADGIFLVLCNGIIEATQKWFLNCSKTRWIEESSQNPSMGNELCFHGCHQWHITYQRTVLGRGWNTGVWLRVGRWGKLNSLRCLAVSIHRCSLSTSFVKLKVLTSSLFSNPFLNYYSTVVLLEQTWSSGKWNRASDSLTSCTASYRML